MSADPTVLATSAQAASDPAFRVRLELPLRVLARNGVRSTFAPLLEPAAARALRAGTPPSKARAVLAARHHLRRRLDEPATVAMVQRQVDLLPTLGLERRATRGRRLVYDIDDAVWLTGSATGGQRLGLLKGAARKVAWLARHADCVVAGSDILAEHLSAYNTNVTVIPSLVDADHYPVVEHGDRPETTLVWVGSATTAPYLRRVLPALERFADVHDRPVRLVVVGAGGTPIAANRVTIDARAWSEESELAALATADIGLMPLPDTPWSRGKCAYKALQYMASGIPAVVDDVGVSAAVVGGAGHVARSEDDWVEGLRGLASDAGARRRLGAAGRERIEADFSLRGWAPALERVLRG